MPELLGNPPSPRTALFWNGTAWQWALVDAAGHLQIDVQTILGLEGALQSVASDRLIVRGEDQLFSFLRNLAQINTTVISGADGWAASNAVPAGQIWKVTNVCAQDQTSPTTEHRHLVRSGASNFYFGKRTGAFAANDRESWSGEVWLEKDDTIWVYFMGGLAGDTCAVTLTGYIMTKET